MSDVLAIGTRTNNAELVADLHQLGYINGNVLDATYGLGRFWSQYRPENLTAVDLDPRRGVLVADFRCLPFASNTFDSATFDPPYKLNGTSTGKGASASDDDYGVGGAYQTVGQKHALMLDGMTECARVTSGHLIVKCQDQICSGSLQMQTVMMIDHGKAIGCKLVDVLHVSGHRKQPPGRRQIHARRDYSTALVFEVKP